jgi:membrane protein DedA with SNARE-associated domain
MQPLQNILTKYGGIGAFIAALTPIPDDLVYIPLGLAKYSIKKFTIVTFLGKFILGEIIVWGTVFLGRPLMEEVLSVSDANNQFSIIVVSVLTVILLVLVLFFTFKVDWSKIIGRWFPWALDKNLDEKNKK